MTINCHVDESTSKISHSFLALGARLILIALPSGSALRDLALHSRTVENELLNWKEVVYTNIAF